MEENKDYNIYEKVARDVRRLVLSLCFKTRSGHIGCAFSIAEILTALYFKHLAVSPENPENPDRDRFILSKGHACCALYAVLAERGFIRKDDLDGFAVNGGLFEQHPNMDIRRGIEASTGSLWHGLSLGAGMALAAKRDQKAHRVYVLLGDGELNEGSVWEAVMFASHHGLDNLVAIVDANNLQALGYTRDIIDMEPLPARWDSFGWATMEIDGHDFGQVFGALERLPFSDGRPSVIIARTVKGKGVSFMEDRLLWHYRAPNDEEYQKALEELSI